MARLGVTEDELSDHGTGREQATPNVVILTDDAVARKITTLRAAAFTWQGLIDRWGSLDALRDEMETYEWLRGDDASAREQA